MDHIKRFEDNFTKEDIVDLFILDIADKYNLKESSIDPNRQGSMMTRLDNFYDQYIIGYYQNENIDKKLHIKIITKNTVIEREFLNDIDNFCKRIENSGWTKSSTQGPWIRSGGDFTMMEYDLYLSKISEKYIKAYKKYNDHISDFVKKKDSSTEAINKYIDNLPQNPDSMYKFEESTSVFNKEDIIDLFIEYVDKYNIKESKGLDKGFLSKYVRKDKIYNHYTITDNVSDNRVVIKMILLKHNLEEFTSDMKKFHVRINQFGWTLSNYRGPASSENPYTFLYTMTVVKMQAFKRHNESIDDDISIHEKINYLVKYGDYINNNIYENLLKIKTRPSNRHDIINYCSYTINPVIYKFDLNKLNIIINLPDMKLGELDSRKKLMINKISEMYHTLKENIWNDIEDIEDNLIELSDNNIDYEIKIGYDLIFTYYYITIYTDNKIETHGVIINCLKSLSKRVKGICDIEMESSSRDGKYIFYIKHILNDSDRQKKRALR